MTEQMKKITDLVRVILIEDMQARDDDRILYILLCQRLNPSGCRYAFTDVFENPEIFGFPHYDSVSRVRRRLQATYPQLRGSEGRINRRYGKWKEMRDYAHSEV